MLQRARCLLVSIALECVYDLCMPSVFIFHGALDTPESNWIPWLRESLVQHGWDVVVPTFPTPKGQNLQNWLHVFEKYAPRIREDSILVGHSTGAAFILSVVEQLPSRIKAAFLVGGFIDALQSTPLVEKEHLNELVRTFIAKDFDWASIRDHCGHFHVFHSENDAYTPLPRAEHMAALLGAKLHVLRDRGHFNSADFPELLAAVQQYAAVEQ